MLVEEVFDGCLVKGSEKKLVVLARATSNDAGVRVKGGETLHSIRAQRITLQLQVSRLKLFQSLCIC